MDASPCLYSGANETMSCPLTRVLRLTPLLVCSYPLQEGNTPLHLTAPRRGSFDTVELLLKHKADADARNKVGEAWWWGLGACAVDLPWSLVSARVAGKGSDWGADAGM